MTDSSADGSSRSAADLTDDTVATAIDVDALEKSARALAEASAYAEGIADTVREPLIVLDGERRVKSANRAYYRTFETTPGDTVGAPFRELAGGHWDLPEVRELLQRVSDQGPSEDVRLDREFPRVGRRVVRVRARRIAHSAWSLLAIEDTTARTRAEEALRRSESGFREMLAGAADPVVMSDAAGRIVYANQAIRAFGYEPGELVGSSIDVLVPERLVGVHASHRAAYSRAATPRRMGLGRDVVARRKDGTECPVEIALSPLDVSEGRLVVAFISDITPRREAERRIADYQTRLQRLAFDTAMAEEHERRSIVADLHDGIGVSLAAAKMKLSVARDGASGEARVALDDALTLVAQCLRDTRTAMFDLSPPILYDLGLRAALGWLTEDLGKRHGLHIAFDEDGSADPFAGSTAALLFRAVRELLVNVVKHARVCEARLVWRRDGDRLVLEVVDGGVGFDSERPGAPSTAFGLFSVREQVSRLGGTLGVTSAPGEGARVWLDVPVPFGSRDGETRA